MRKTYEERGMKFAKFLAKLFQDCVYLRDFEYVLAEYNYTHSRKLQWAHGVSRIAIMRADYVIKFDFQPVGMWEDGHAGDCYSEEETIIIKIGGHTAQQKSRNGSMSMCMTSMMVMWVIDVARFASLIMLGAFNQVGRYYTALFFCSPRGPPGRAEISIIPHPSAFCQAKICTNFLF